MADTNPKPIDLTNQIFGRLTVLKEGEPSYKPTAIDKVRNRRYSQRVRRWECLCVCGNAVIIDQSSLTTHHTISCGCFHKEQLGDSKRKHGQAGTPTHQVWKGMRTRCNNPTDATYKYYGARGITVCERWSSFANFLEDMGEKPEGMTIDRIDVNGNYEPTNCRWATADQQANNKRNNVVLTHNGITMTGVQWAKHLNIPAQRIYSRVAQQLPVELILSTKVGRWALHEKES